MANYVWDEKTKRYVMKKTEGAAKPASSGNYVSARIAANKQALANDVEWQGRSKTASIRAAAKDLTNKQRFEKYQSQLGEGLYKRGGSTGITKIVKDLGDYQQYHKTLMDNIDLFDFSDEEREELIGAANTGLEIANSYRNLARARTGDKSVLDGATGDQYKEYEHLLNLSGYDRTGENLLAQNNTKDFDVLAERSKDFDLENAMLTVEDYYRMINTPVMGDGMSGARVNVADYEKAADDIESFTGINVRNLTPDQVQGVLEEVGANREYVGYLQDYLKREQAAKDEEAARNKWQQDFSANWNSIRTAPDYKTLSHAGVKNESFLANNEYADKDYIHPSEVYPAQAFPEVASGVFDFMTEEELRDFTYLYQQPGEGGEQARAYINDLAPELLRRRAEKQTQDATEFAGKNAFTGALSFLGARAGNALNSIVGAVDMLATPFAATAGIVDPSAMESDPNDIQYDFARYVQALEKANMQNIADATEGLNIAGINIPSQLYSGLGSITDSFLSGALLGPQGASAALSAGAYNTARHEGADRLDAGVTAAFEGLTEKYSLDALLDGSGSAAKKILQNMLVEPTEELANMALNLGWDSLRYGEDGEVGTRFSELRTMGYSPYDASIQIAKEYGKEALATVISSAFAGAVGGAGGAAVNAAEDNKAGGNLQSNDAVKPMLDLAATLDLPEDVKAIVQEQQKAAGAGENISTAKIGRIFREMMKVVDEKTQDVLSATMGRNISRMLKANGVSDPDIAASITRIITDNGTASSEDYKRVATNDSALKLTEGLVATYDAGTELNEKAGRIAEQAAIKKPAQVNNPPEAEEEAEPVSETDELTPEEMEAAGIQSDVQIDEQAAKEMVDAAAAEYGRNADIVAAAYEAGQDPVSFNQQFRQAYQYGEEGRNYDVISKSSTFSTLNEQQIKKAYLMGRDVRVQRAQEAAKQPVGRVKVGNVDTSKIRNVKLNDYQKAAISSISELAKAVGFNVEFVSRGFDEHGKAKSNVNGVWSKETRTITLDVNAGRLSRRSANYAIMQTAGHELTHFIKAFADADLWNSYQEFVFSHLSEKMTEAALDTKIDDYIKRWAKNNKALTRDGAIEEIVADASGDALLKLTEADIQQMAESNPSLLKRIGDFIQRWVKEVKSAIEQAYKGQIARNAIADQMVDVVDELGAKWAELLKNAAQHARAVKGENVAVNAQEEVQFSLQENDRLMENAAAMNSSKGNVPDDVLKKAEMDRAKVAAFMRDDSRTLNLPEDLMGNTFFSDAAYGGSEENTTVCPRSIGADAFLDAVSDKIGRPLTVAEQVRISQDVIGAADIKEPQCIYCYVAADRAAYREFLGKYIDQRDSVIDALKNGETDTDALYETFLNGRKDTPNMKKRFKLWVDSYRAGKRMLSASDLSNIGVLTSIQSDKYKQLSGDANFAAQMKDALAYAQSASWAKKRVNYVAYNGHILKWTQNRINKLNSMYGLRMYSFSDFSPAFALENMQMVTDAAVRGLKMLAYTKVPAFAEIFANTGMNINVSVFATEVKGDSGSSIVENNLMGADWKAAQKLRSEHENIGVTFVATSDAQVEWALAQDWIDVVIPYHLVRTGRTIAEMMKYKNYTAESGDTKKPNWSKASGNLSSIPAALHNNDRDTYMRLLEENNLEPRFARFVDNPNYMKLVNETRQSVTTSKPVQPIFNTDAAINALQDMANNGGYYVPVGGSEQRMYELADEFAGRVQAGEYQSVISEADDVKYSIADDEEYMQAYEDGDDYTARQIVKKAAAAAGYSLTPLYHGTAAFGFTKINPEKSDDGISFFVSDDDLVAETYVGENTPIRRIGSNNMDFDKLMAADGETLLSLLQKHVDGAYQLVDKTEARQLAREEGEVLRLREIPKIRELIDREAESISEWGGDDNVIKAAEAVVESLDRMSYASSRDLAENLYIAYDDALRDLRSVDSTLAGLISYTVGNEVYRAYNQMQFYLSGDLFKIEDDWSEEFTSRTQAMDMLVPKLFKGIYELYGRMDNLLEVDAGGLGWRHIDGSFIGQSGYVSTREVSAYAKANGYNGVYFRNIVDVGGMANYHGASNVLTFFNPNDLKSADPYTYDDDGNLIPPSKRFNRDEDDIRYSIEEDTEGHKVVVVEEDILKGIYSGGKWTLQQKTDAKKAARAAIAIVGPIYSDKIPIYITGKTKEEFPSSKYVFNTLSKEKQMLADRFRISADTENLVMATTNWGPSTLEKPRRDFSRFIRGAVYMNIHGRKYKATVKVGITPAGKHVLYDLVEMEPAFFEMKKESVPSAAKAKAVAPYSGSPSTEDIVTHSSADDKSQIQDPDQITDRELLANVMESAAENAAELDFVRRYRKQLDQLDQKQADMEAAHAEMVAARKAGQKDEAIKLKNKVDILAKQIDRMDGQLLKFEAGKPLQAVVKRQREQLREKANERIKKRVEKVRQQEAEKRDELRARIDTLRQEKNRKIEQLRREKTDAVTRVRDEKNESFGKQKYRKRIEEDVARLRTWVTTPTNKEHVPQFLRGPMGDLINALDFSSARALNGGEATQKDEKLAAALDAMNLALTKIRSQQEGLDKGAANFATIIDLPYGYTEEFAEMVASIKATMTATRSTGDIPINRMTANQLKELSEALRTLTTSIRQMNRLLANAKYESAISAANDTMDDLGRMTAQKDRFKITAALGKFMDWTNTVPVYAFKRFGKGGMAIFDGLMDGWDKLAFNADELVKFANATYTTKEVRQWSRETRRVELSSGDSVRMTTAQLMSLYCLSKRAQAVGHLLGGGIRIADIESRGKNIVQSENYTLSQTDLDGFGDMLTERQRKVADRLQEFMSNRGSEWGNEISMKRFGYEMFTEDHYFPIETDSNNRIAIDEQAAENSLFRLLNLSATKGLVKGANNAIVVRDIFDVFTAHTSDMAKYNALGLQILDALKWLNYVEKTQNDDGTLTTRSVQKALERAYGKDARSYILNLLRDLNGIREGGRNDGLVNKVISNAKVASVAGNLRVYFLQATSMPRAAYAINPKYLTIGFAKMAANPLKGARLAEEKVGIAKWKSMGFYDTNISGNIREMVKHDQSVPAKIRDATLAPAGFMDGMTLGVIYRAVEAEIADKHRDVVRGSSVWDKLVNNRVRDIVYRTQVVDSTMTRSDAMRGKGIITLATSFMSEPTLTMNMLADSIYDARMKHRGMDDIKHPTLNMAKALGVFTLTAVLTAAVEAAFDAERDDDEFETFAEKYMSAFIGDLAEGDSAWQKFTKILFSNVGSNLNILNNIPFASDAMGMLEGYDNSPMYSAFIDSFKSSYDAYQRWMEGKGTVYSWVYSGLKGLSQFSGLPVSNISREGVSVWNTFFADKYAKPRIQTYANTKKEAAQAYYAAIVAGDTERADFIRERAEINGISGSDIADAAASYIKDDYISGAISESVARKYLSAYAGKSSDKIDTNMRDWGYQRNTGLKYSDMKRDYLDGLITKSQAQTLLMQYRSYDSEEVYWQLSKWDYEKATGEEGGKYSWFLDAVEDGYGYEKYAQELLNHGVDKSDIASAIAGACKAEYLAIKGTAAGERMLEYLLDVYESIGYDREYERDYITKKWN